MRLTHKTPGLLHQKGLSSASAPTKEFSRGTEVICCWLCFLLFAYCFVFITCLFASQMQKERLGLEFQTSLKPLAPNLAVFRSPSKPGIQALLREEVCHPLTQREKKGRTVTRHTAGENTDATGSEDYLSCVLLVWLCIFYVPQCSHIKNGDRIVSRA